MKIMLVIIVIKLKLEMEIRFPSSPKQQPEYHYYIYWDVNPSFIHSPLFLCSVVDPELSFKLLRVQFQLAAFYLMAQRIAEAKIVQIPLQI